MPDVVEDPVRRQRYVFSETADVLEIDVWAEPGGDVPEHFHPALEERFRVLEGNVRFTLADREHLAHAGNDVIAPVGVRHSFQNIGNAPAHLRVEARPPLRLRAFLEEAAAFSRAGKYTRRGVPKGPRAAIELAELAQRYRDVTVVTSPPLAVQRLLLPPLARLGRRRKAKSGPS